MSNTEAKYITELRRIIDRRKVKITYLAKRVGIPYRTLQNYLSGRHRIPLQAYIDICYKLGITAEYPLVGKFKLDHHALQKAILMALGPVLPYIELNKSSEMSVRKEPIKDDTDAIRIAGFLAAMIAGHYDLRREVELGTPVFDEEDYEEDET